nr:HAMP domain-containing protein [Dehalococcoidales bacterium]
MNAALPRAAARPPRFSLPIRLRLTLWYVVLLAAILLAFCAYLYVSLSHSLANQLDMTLATVATQVQATVDNEDGRAHLDRTATQPAPGVVVALYDSSGQTLLVGSPPWSPAALEATRAEAAAGTPTYSTVYPEGGGAWRVLAVPVREGGPAEGVLEVGQSAAEMEATLRGLLLLMALAVPAVLVVAAGGGLFLAQRALSPIDRITRLAQRIEAEDLSRRLDLPPSGDEVGRLAATFDGMLDRLDRAFRRQRRFVADASHELRTPLAVITSQVDVTLERPRKAEE